MPNLATIVNRVFLHQTLLYWQKAGSDTYGKPAYQNPTAPVLIKCRWEDREQEVIDSQGRKVIARTYVLLVNPIVVGSLVFLGTLSDWANLPTYPSLPTVLQGSKEVIKLNTTPDIKALSTIYEAWLL